MYIVANPTYDGRFTSYPYGLAPVRSGPTARYSGQRARRKACCGGCAKHRMPRRATLGALGLTATSPGGQAIVKVASTVAAIGGPIGMAVGALVGIIGGLIGAHHAAAVQKQATSIDAALPNFLNTISQIMASANARQTSPTAAILALQQAQSTYYSQVSNFIKKSGPCSSSCTFISSGGTKPNGYCGPSSCNEGCGVGCMIVEPAVRALSSMIQAGGGTLTIPAYTSSDINTPPVNLSYSGPSGGVTGALASIPITYYAVGAGVLLLVLLLR